MELIQHLLRDNPATPRLTVYDEAQGSRLDFSAITLENWAAKVGNMLIEELDLDESSQLTIDLPVGWQAAAIALGAIAAGVRFSFENEPSADADVVFTSPDRFRTYRDSSECTADVVLVTDDPFGRGVVETGGQLPSGALDFGPTVRFYGDDFPAPTATLAEHLHSEGVEHSPNDPARVLSTGWHDTASFYRAVLVPLAAGGSSVVVAGLVGTERLSAIAAEEKVSTRL